MLRILNNNMILVIIILLSNFMFYMIDKNFGYTKSCYTGAAVWNILFGIKITINSYKGMNKQNINKKLSSK